MQSLADLAALPAPFLLRPMTLEDLDAVMEVERIAYQSPWSRLGYEKELRFNDLAHYQVLQVRTGDQSRIIGYSGYWIIADEGHISIVALHPEWRGYGLGEMMLVNMLYLIVQHGATLATLEVRASNDVAQQLYRKAGFEVVGRRKQYYSDTREDALIMTIEPLDAPYRQQLQQRWLKLIERIAQAQV